MREPGPASKPPFGAAGLASPPARDRPALAGYRVEQPLGAGSSGVVWAARRDADGRRYAVKVVARAFGSPGCRPDGVDRSELAVLRSLAHPHVVRLVEDRELPDGRLALVLELAAGGSLARVLRARGHLTTGETVTLVTALGTTLSDLHRRGLTHGDLSPANVLFRPDGRPMLSDLGLATVAGLAVGSPAGTSGFVDPAVLAGGAPAPAADVYALGAVAWTGLTGTPPGPAMTRPSLIAACPGVPADLALALEAALDADPARRPDPAALARAAYASAPAEPIRLAPGHDPAGALTHRIRELAAQDVRAVPTARPPDPWMGRGALLLAAVAALAGLVPIAASGRHPPAAQPLSLVEQVAALTDARSDAFALAAVADPGGFDLPGSPAWQADEQSLRQLHGQGLRYRGLRLLVSHPHVLRRSPRAAVVQVTQHTSAYDVVAASGAIWAHRAAAPAQRVTLELALTGSGWRVSRSAAVA